jgi:hypothetical protein
MASATKVLPAKSVTEVFPGPRAFRMEEEKLFFGRNQEASQLTDLLLAYQDVFLYAPSGAGKTSLINARLVPQLENCYVARVGGELPSGVELENIPNIFDYNLVASIAGHPDKTFPVELSLEDYFRILPEPENHKNTFLIIDQMEEIFTTYPERWTHRLEFFKHLQSLLKRRPDLHLLFAIREEFVAPLEFYSDLFPNRLHIRYQLQGLRSEQAAQAIRGPLLASGFNIDEKTTATLVDSLRTVPVKTPRGVKKIPGEFVEPLHLQVVCRDLVAQLRSGSNTITESEVTAFADVDQTLSDFYQRAVAATVSESNVGEAKIRSWFDQALITPAGTRGIVFQGEQETAGLPNAAVLVLARESMIRLERRAGALWCELTHDRFIDPIRESNIRWREQASLSSRQLVWPDNDLEKWLFFKAAEILDSRAQQDHSRLSKEEIVGRYLARLTPEEVHYQTEQNWKQAELYLANDVLDGKFDLVRSLTPNSYHRIEGPAGRRWLREAKTLKAYLIWEAGREAPNSEGAAGDYLKACRQILDHLLSPQKKLPQDAFEPVQKYVENSFLKNRKLDSASEKTKLWIAVKSQRLQDLQIVREPEKSKAEAERHMKKFYEHIGPAVLRDDAKSKESVRSVLQSLGLYRQFEHYEAMVNCFEMAIAIYFLHPEKIAEVLAEQEA